MHDDIPTQFGLRLPTAWAVHAGLSAASNETQLCELRTAKEETTAYISAKPWLIYPWHLCKAKPPKEVILNV